MIALNPTAWGRILLTLVLPLATRHPLVCLLQKGRPIGGAPDDCARPKGAAAVKAVALPTETASAQLSKVLQTIALAKEDAAKLTSPEEVKHLKLLVCSRLVCSAVLGAYSYSKDPGNEYLLLHAQPCWLALELLWGTPDDTVCDFFALSASPCLFRAG